MTAPANDLPTIDSPAEHAQVVTPNDGTDLVLTGARAARALLIGGTGGNVVVDTLGGESSVTIAVAANSYLLLRVKRVRATGTTATPIYALW